ncbi:glycosyltransferase [Aquincola sp. J276]|uniref:glycosyltransferase n=1 Tax=Aquincola sp. J276 TaxID=2898432 RepID=UPI002150CD69|nr:glycosyltransferase [Aquincola sp. J276]MCR5865092.1 glycosyltransferase [Aquincola sp. J276]
MTASGQAPRRVVMVAHSHILGGMERRVVSTSAALAERGHQVAFAGPLDGWMGERMRADGHTCLHVPMHGMYDPLSAWKLARFARRWRADVLHGQAQRGGRYADWASRWSGVAAVASANSMISWRWFRPEMKLLAVSNAVRDHLVQHGLPAAQVSVVYSAVPDIGMQPARLAGPTPEQPLQLLMNSRLVDVKAHDVALDALALLPATLPVHLAITGATDTPWAAQIRAQAERLGLAGRVSFLGQRQDIPELLAACDVVLAPSRHEALSLTLMETCAAGRPAIATAVGGNAEIIAEGASGLLVPSENAQALADAIVRLGSDSALRVAMGRAARDIYERRFTADIMVRNTVAAYDEARAARRGRAA